MSRRYMSSIISLFKPTDRSLHAFLHRLFMEIELIVMVPVGRVETGIIKAGMVVTFVLFSCRLK